MKRKGVDIHSGIASAANASNSPMNAPQSNTPEISVLIADDQDLIRNGFRLILSSYDGISVVGEAGDGAQAYELARLYKPDVVLMDIRMPNVNGITATQKIVSDPACAHTHVLVLTTFDIDEYVYDALEAGASGFMLKDAEPDDIVRAIRVVSKGDALIQPSITRRLIEHFVRQQRNAQTNLSDQSNGNNQVVGNNQVYAGSQTNINSQANINSHANINSQANANGFSNGYPAGANSGFDIPVSPMPQQALNKHKAKLVASLTDRERQILMLVARGLDNEEIAEGLVISPATVKTHIARIMAKLDAHDRAQLVVDAYECGLVVPGM